MTGSAVNFVVSTGPPLVAAPNVVGLTQVAATTAITGAGLVVGLVTNASSATVPAGSVISQTPVGGTQVAPGSAVNLTVSSGPADLRISKTHTGSFRQSQSEGLYTITVANAGSGSTTGTVTVTDSLPTGLTATAIGGTGWTCAQPAGPCTRSDVLAAGSELSSPHADGECGEQRAGHRDEHGDGERRRRCDTGQQHGQRSNGD